MMEEIVDVSTPNPRVPPEGWTPGPLVGPERTKSRADYWHEAWSLTSHGPATAREVLEVAKWLAESPVQPEIPPEAGETPSEADIAQVLGGIMGGTPDEYEPVQVPDPSGGPRRYYYMPRDTQGRSIGMGLCQYTSDEARAQGMGPRDLLYRKK